MAALLLLHLAAGLGGIALGGRLGRRGLILAAVPLLATVAWLASHTATILDDGVVTESIDWVPSLDISIDLRLDGFSGLMAMLVAGIGLLVEERDEEQGTRAGAAQPVPVSALRHEHFAAPVAVEVGADRAR